MVVGVIQTILEHIEFGGLKSLLERLKTFIGLDVEKEKCAEILSNLGFKVEDEDGKLKNIDIVEEKLNVGFNAVYQDIRGFKLNKDDKIMLMSGLKPLCKEHVVK